MVVDAKLFMLVISVPIFLEQKGINTLNKQQD